MLHNIKQILSPKIDNEIKNQFKISYTNWLHAQTLEEETQYMIEMRKIYQKANVVNVSKLIPEKVRANTPGQKKKQKRFKKDFMLTNGVTIQKQMQDPKTTFVALAIA